MDAAHTVCAVVKKAVSLEQIGTLHDYGRLPFDLLQDREFKMNSKLVREVEATELAKLIKSDRAVLVDFYATWCGPSRAMEPIIELLASRFAGRAEIVKVDIDGNSTLVAENHVRAVPTFLLFAGGKATKRIVGGASEIALAALIHSHLAEYDEPDEAPHAA